MSNNIYGGSNSSSPLEFLESISGNAAAIGIVTIVCLLIAVAGAIVLYFTFLSKKNENKFQKIVGWFYNFLNFKSIIAEGLLKIGYLITAIFATLFQLVVPFFTDGGSIGGKILGCLVGLVVWNVVIRLTYEFMLVGLVICRNTTEINKKMEKNSVAKVSNYEKPESIGSTESTQIGIVFCRNCGNKYNSTEGICPSCGANRE